MCIFNLIHRKIDEEIKCCENCLHYNTDRNDMPCCRCNGQLNWERAEEIK